MYEHKYDESGLASSYLSLTLIAPIALYQSYKLYKGHKTPKCTCKPCQTNKTHTSYFRFIFVGILWLIVSFLLKNILTIKITAKKDTFDPFEILKIEEGATLEQIKKAYKKALRPLRRLINRPEMKNQVQEKLKEINKANDILKDQDSYSKWLSNETKKELFIALPAFVMKFGRSSFFAYILIFIVLIPLLSYRKYKTLKYKNICGSFCSSAESFYENIESFSNSEEIIIQQIQVFMAKSEDFMSRKWKNDLKSLKDDIEKNFGMPMLLDSQSYLHLMDYLFRTQRADPSDSEYVKSSSLKMIESFLKISAFKGKTKIFDSLLILEKMICQAVFSPEFYMLQFPNIKFEDIFLYKKKPTNLSNSKVSLSDSKSNLLNETVDENPVNMKFRNEIDFISKHLSGEEKEQAMNIIKRIPLLEIKDAKVFIYETSIDKNTGHMTDKYEPIIDKEGDCFKVDKNSTATLEFKLVKIQDAVDCHSPFGRVSIQNRWTIRVSFNGKMSENVIFLDEFKNSKNIKLSLPAWSGKGELKISAVSNGYFGADSEEKLNIRYY